MNMSTAILQTFLAHNKAPVENNCSLDSKLKTVFTFHLLHNVTKGILLVLKETTVSSTANVVEVYENGQSSFEACSSPKLLSLMLSSITTFHGIHRLALLAMEIFVSLVCSVCV